MPWIEAWSTARSIFMDEVLVYSESKSQYQFEKIIKQKLPSPEIIFLSGLGLQKLPIDQSHLLLAIFFLLPTC